HREEACDAASRRGPTGSGEVTLFRIMAGCAMIVARAGPIPPTPARVGPEHARRGDTPAAYQMDVGPLPGGVLCIADAHSAVGVKGPMFSLTPGSGRVDRSCVPRSHLGTASAGAYRGGRTPGRGIRTAGTPASSGRGGWLASASGAAAGPSRPRGVVALRPG